jgi:hypothetical protein
VPGGELIFANVLDLRQRAAEGDMANGLVYLLTLPARALPFAVVRDWKNPTGYMQEEVQLLAPSGNLVHRIGPEARYMYGQMDVTHFEDVVGDAHFEELGTHLASFLLDDELIAQAEFQVVLQAPPQKFSAEVEEGLKKSDVIWAGVEYQGNEVTAPVWFAYRGGKIYLLSSREPSLEEQSVPGLPEARDMVVITRRKYRDTSLERFHVSARVLDGQEWEQAAALLADRRRSRLGPPQDSIKRWRDSCVIAELTPVLPG